MFSRITGTVLDHAGDLADPLLVVPARREDR